jgi:hypothetical protein
VCWRSSLVVNHHTRHLDQDKIIPKHHNRPVHPHRVAQSERSQKSNWASSPGSVWIGIDTRSAGENRGPRNSRNPRVTVE